MRTCQIAGCRNQALPGLSVCPLHTETEYRQNTVMNFGGYPQNTVETVNHPQHYGGDTPYEVIKVLEAWLTADEFRGFLKGNVHKYLARAGKKGSATEDAAKASWYAARLDVFNKKQEIR